MGATMKGRDILSLRDINAQEIDEILDLAIKLKKERVTKRRHPILDGRTLALIFEKPSTRTRVSFEVAAVELGAHPVFLSAQDLQLGRGETIEDTGRTLARYVDAIVIRSFSQAGLEALAAASDVPVINALSDDFHPCQVLADLLTLREKKGALGELKLAYVGDGNNVCNDLLLGAAKVGLELAVASPAGYGPESSLVDEARTDADDGQRIFLTDDPRHAVSSADAVYTDVWASMGQEEERAQRLKDFRGFQVDGSLLKLAKPDALVMHCLPAHRGEEIDALVIDGSQSIVFDQAENRLHAQKALLSLVVS